jgi:hypothetical protein
MAQTTGAVANACAKVWISTDNITYTDISGVAQSVADTEQTRISGEAYTFTGEGAIVKSGKKEPLELTFTIVYSETDAEAYQVVRQLFETATCSPNFYVRWSPRGGAADDEQITSGAGVITAFTYPPADATQGGPIITGFKVKVGDLTTTIIAS